MDRQAWTKSFKKSIIPNFINKPYWEATGKMRVKLLRYPEDEKDRQTDGRKPIEEDLDSIIRNGFLGEIELKGWFDDLTNHFRGKVKEVTYIPVSQEEDEDVQDERKWHHKLKDKLKAGFAKAKSALGFKAVPKGFMDHMFIPWREVDIRFDEGGAHVRFDWQYDNSHRVGRQPQGIFSRMKSKISKEVGYGIFRLDALPDERDKPPEQEHEKHRADSTYQAMTYSRNIMSVMTLRMDTCVSTPPETKFRCILEQRPMSASESRLYFDPPYGNEKQGSWFTFLGTVGRLQLNFERVQDENGKENYEATPELSWCGGFSPCPFVVHEPFKAQFLHNLIVLEQSEQGLELARRDIFHFYPLFKDESGEEGVTNQNGFTDESSIAPKIKPDEHAIAEQQKAKELEEVKAQLGEHAKSEETCMKTMEDLTAEIAELRNSINQLKK